MKIRRLTEIAAVVGGRIQDGDHDPAIRSVAIDSREVGPGTLFFALPGEHRDGHEFVADAISRSAAAAVVADRGRLSHETSSAPHLIVTDRGAPRARLARTGAV